MSDLLDEIEAINSIYGAGTLVSAGEPGTYILRLPEGSSSVRVRFPEGYPGVGPVVLGTQHARGGVRGAGERDVVLLRGVLGEVFREGCVCLFDGMEEFRRRREGDVVGVGGGTEVVEVAGEEEEEEEEEEEAEWTVSEVVVENKSTFVARVARARSPDEARRLVRRLVADRKIGGATHNITAWRIRSDEGAGAGAGAGLQFQDCDDDGETAAGGRLLHLMQVMDVWGVVVVVSRWFGGVKLGPRRFAVINAVARDAMVRAGVVEAREKRRR
ncbi:hypothetical protein E4U53_003338 [Claviceps sorghi]|nr:hypothetical protein E4U53_003338 [Claviceps sorghi]